MNKFYKDYEDYLKKVSGDRVFKTKEQFNAWLNSKSLDNDFETPEHWKKIPKGGWENAVCFWRRKRKNEGN